MMALGLSCVYRMALVLVQRWNATGLQRGRRCTELEG
jgi:hypothetical protein